MNIIIAGAGAAGMAAAEAARKQSPDAGVTVFNLERQSPYFRPRLPDVISGKVTLDKIQAHPDAWWREHDIEFRRGEELVEVSLESLQARGSLGSRLRWDRLLIAAGAKPFVPEIEGARGGALKGIYPLRTIADAMELKLASEKASSAVLLGSGLLGLEIGYALTQKGLKVHVLEKADRILPFQTTPKSAALLQGLLADKGFVFHLGTELARVTGAEKVERVLLKSGEELEAGFVAVACGVRSDTALAKALGAKVDKGVVVDQYMETTIPNVYAAGDCAQTPDGRGGQWAIAHQEGLAAGLNLALGDRAARKPYQPTPPSALLKVTGTDLIAAGNIDPENKLPFAEYITDSSYRKVVVSQLGQLCGFTNLGTTAGNRELTSALNKKAPISPELLKDMEKGDFDFSRLKDL
jgi:nitrite reductase (NADH) large subunit